VHKVGFIYKIYKDAGQQNIKQGKVICLEITDSVLLPGSMSHLRLEVFPWHFDTANLKCKTPCNIAFV